ncbi:hypothetical protein ACFWA5_36800 [Streptomyces mirabilis]|uniref:hypothetical protein n=1 Tax=Streptomyces mirabilis TaxID=68239 RepID=UPI00365B3688
MDAVITRLRLAADYLKRESSAAVEELMVTAFHAVPTSTVGVGELDRRGEGSTLPPPGGDPRPAHLSTEQEQQRLHFQHELEQLLTEEQEGKADGKALRRIAELTELFKDEQQAQVWWYRAALQDDPVAIMMLADND